MVERDGKILIVDDEKAIRDLIHEGLMSEGYHCEEAGNAGEALSHLRGSYADLVLLDIKMPGKSGMELLPEIKECYPDVAVIMATVIGDVDTAVKCMREGAYDYITKPFRLDEVVHAVKKAMEQRRLELELRDYQRHLKQKVEEQAKDIRKLFLGSIEALVFALEAKDRYTAGHSRRVTEIAMAIGSELGLSADDIEDLRWGSLLHDVGKIAVDQLIQNKPGRLTPEEYEHIMTHAHVGAGIVKPVVNENVVEIIEHHHDRYDGGGLHQIVAGCDIPLAARILALADAFDAMTSDRPYRSAMSREEALAEIKRCAGTQFDPVVVTAFLKTVITKGVPTTA
jgi:putative nucleotidyltransferase with HDIG domain